MDMKMINDLLEAVCKELQPIARKKNFTPGELQMVHMNSETIKNLLKIRQMEGVGYSQDGRWEAQMNGSYGDGNSYAGRGQHYVRGHYSRDNGASQGYSMNNGSDDYSSASGKMANQLEEMMHNCSNEQDRAALRRCISELHSR